MKVFQNAAQCRQCGDVIESKHRHDYRACTCGEIFVDGGLVYLRRGARDLSNFIELSKWEDEEPAGEEEE